MVVVRIWEGLGNQLFQYAYARALQLRNNEDVRLCALHGQGDRTYRQYELDKFAITLPRDKNFERIAMCLDKCGNAKELIKKIFVFPGICRYVEEKSVHYDEKLRNIHGNYFLNGWFQNEKYFKDYEEVIRNEIRPRKRIKIPKKLRYILDNENTVSVHIRRGDYKKYHTILNREYYDKALELIDQEVENAFYLVFSDDLDWVQKHMNFSRSVYFVNSDKKLEDYEELIIMSKCKNNIIANSTFSWWGAWLNDNKQKIVIGPRQWAQQNNVNIMPDTWIKI